MMTKTRRKAKDIEVFKTLEIVGEYTNSTSFYNENKELVFDSVVELYKELLTTKKNELKLEVLVSLEEESRKLSWTSEFIYDKKSVNVLIDDIIPFYESIEKYEKCVEVLNLHNGFTKTK
jgi:hypothetical protein